MGPKLQDFEIIDTIGRGSHGTIRTVKRKNDGQILVWKELHYASMSEAEKQGLVLEVNLLRELHHPNIVRFFNHLVDRRTGTLFILMEYCPGGDLRHLINKCCKTGSFLEEGFIWRVLKQVCKALRTCHEKPFEGGAIILHRDIKPANVFLDKDGNIKLGDFGLARTLNSNASFARTFVGTPYYMSPEVINGREYNERSDIWSLGCLIYELCSLEPPFKASNQSELYTKIKTGRYKRIPVHYSSGLWEVIQEMLKQEDFLRPSAFMILHHSALEANTLPKEVKVEDDLSDSLALLLSLNANKKVSNEGKTSDDSALPSQSKSVLDATDEDETSYTSSFAGTVKERVISEEEKQMEESLMKEIEMLLKESQLRKERERMERLQGNALSLNLLELPTGRDMGTSKEEGDTESKDRSDKSNSLPSISFKVKVGKVLSPPKCVCGGTSLEEWKERVSSVRAAEESVKTREMAVEEREREMAKRERRVHTIEQEAKQHLVRAQIYLKQIKSKGQSVPLPPKLGRDQEISDFDATTVSADIGYDDTPTVAFLDTQPKNNPFLKMRENLNKRNHLAQMNTNLSRSNTIDNPKSRRKHGNYFYLEKGAEKQPKETDQLKRKLQIGCMNLPEEEQLPIYSESNSTGKDCAKLKVIQSTKESILQSNKMNLKENVRNNLKIKDAITSNLRNASKCKENPKRNSGNILTALRQNFTRNNLVRKSAKGSQMNKENGIDGNKKQRSSVVEDERKPLRIINTKRFHSKGVCAQPEKSVQPVKVKPSLMHLNSSRKNINSQDQVFRVYNAV